MKFILITYLIITFLTWSMFLLRMKIAINEYKFTCTKEQLEKIKNRKKNVPQDIFFIIKSLAFSAVPIFNMFLLLSLLFREDFLDCKVNMTENDI